ELIKAFKRLMKDKFQMSFIGELAFFLGLQVKQKDDGIFISRDKYVTEILRKFSFTDVKSASTPIEIEKPLLKDRDAEDVDVHIYKSIIGSLMYLTSSRPDIMFVVCACARFQVTPKVSHLHAVKIIFRHLKGKLHLGLWYPKDSPFNLVAYSNSDYAGASLDRKSTTKVTTVSSYLLLLKEKYFGLCFSWFWTNLCKLTMLHSKELASPKQTALGKDISNPFMAASLPKTIWSQVNVVEGFTIREEEEVEMPIASAPPFPTNAHSPPPQDLTPTPYATPPQDQPFTPLALPPQEQPTTTFKSSMSLLTTLMETCTSLSQKVAELEQAKHTQALKILQLKKRVKKLEKKNRSKSSGFKRLRRVGTTHRVESSTDTVVGAQEDASKHEGKIEAIDADEDIILVDVETQEEVTMTMAQTLIKLKAEKAKLLDEQIAQKLHDEEENIDWNVVAEQIQERHLDDIRKYQSLKKKPVFIAQSRKNMIIYLKNMAGYKMEHFRGMTYEKVRPIFEREYKMVQTLFKPDKDIEEPKKKRVADETLLQESFKKLRAAKFSEAYQSFEDMLKGFGREDLVALWNLVKEKFSSAVLNVDKEKALWVKLKRLFKPDADDVRWKLQRYIHAPLTWKLYTDCGVHHVSSTKGHDIFMLIEKDYPLSNGIMIMMLSEKLQVEEDNEMARDLVMKIFMKANKPKSRSLDTSSKRSRCLN
nr:uncharacterized mitochondrial protein AtMg00810-like [Tanacetum cinerariifolium]